MKTDRFDEEFRRKLQDLPVDADKADVERTYAYVRTNNPVMYGIGWSKLLLFGVGGLLLLGSLLYNSIQYVHTTQLQTSLDSLSRQSTSQVVGSGVVQYDTIYITRTEMTGSYSSPTSPDGYQEAAPESSVKPSAPFSSAPQLVDEVPPGETRVVSRAGQRERGVSIGTVPSKSSLPADASVDASQPVERTTPRIESADAVESVASNSSSTNQLSRSVAISPATPPLSEKKTSVTEPFAGTESTRRWTVTTTRSTSQRKDRQANQLGRQVGIVPSVNNSGSEITAAAIRPVIIAEPLANRPLIPASGSPGNRLADRSLTVPKTELAGVTKATKRPWHLIIPRLSVPKAQYRAGVGLLGGSDQLSGALLGELQINRHWSVQAGIQVSLVDGFHYRDEQDFGKHRNNDFRQTYGVLAPTAADLEDINLRSTLFQLPVQVAYHYPLGRQWGLRFGLGTELTVGARSTVGYDYRENNRSNEYELTVNNGSVNVFNNLTVSTSLERSWKRWYFRAGPFISPQLRPVSYKSDDLLWGGSLQVLYLLGK